MAISWDVGDRVLLFPAVSLSSGRSGAGAAWARWGWRAGGTGSAPRRAMGSEGAERSRQHRLQEIQGTQILRFKPNENRNLPLGYRWRRAGLQLKAFS